MFQLAPYISKISFIFRKQKWDEDDFEGELEEDYDDDMAEEGLQVSREAITPGRGILLLPHRQLHPHSQLVKAQLVKARAELEPEQRATSFPTLPSQGQQHGQDHTDWTYEEQFRQVRSGTLCVAVFSGRKCVKKVVRSYITTMSDDVYFDYITRSANLYAFCIEAPQFNFVLSVVFSPINQ